MSDLDLIGSWREDASALTEPELDFLLQAQRALIVEQLGVLGLTSDLRFAFACIGDRPVGMLAVRRDDDAELWVQIAYVDPEFRRRGVFSKLMQSLTWKFPENRIGLGVRIGNTPMLQAAERYGFKSRVAYLYWEPKGSR